MLVYQPFFDPACGEKKTDVSEDGNKLKIWPKKNASTQIIISSVLPIAVIPSFKSPDISLFIDSSMSYLEI